MSWSSWNRNQSSTACFAHSCTTTSPSITSATRASPRSSSPIAARTASCACSRGSTDAKSAPASHSFVIVAGRLGSVVTFCSFTSRSSAGSRRSSGLDEREARVRRAGLAVEVAGRDEQPGAREPVGDRPAVGAGVVAQPEVEQHRAAGVAQADGREPFDRERAALLVALPLHLDVRVVAERGDRGRLRRRRHHETGVLAGLDEVVDERRVAGVEPDAHAREVRALREAVHREHTVEARRRGSWSGAERTRRSTRRSRSTTPCARPHSATRSRYAASATDDDGLPGSLIHSSSARSASSALIASRSRCQSASSGTGTARSRASVAPMSYDGYATAG